VLIPAVLLKEPPGSSRHEGEKGPSTEHARGRDRRCMSVKTRLKRLCGCERSLREKRVPRVPLPEVDSAAIAWVGGASAWGSSQGCLRALLRKS